MSDLFAMPREKGANRKKREKLLTAASGSQQLRSDLWEACRQDILFWINFAGWIYEPRTKRKMPWITWAYQDDTLPKIAASLGKEDIWIEKSRDMGATWMCLAAIVHEWQFEENAAFMLVSRNEILVDRKGDPDSLFWKVDFLIQNQPPFLLPPEKMRRRTELNWQNAQRSNSINGASTTGDVGAGGRRTAIMLDELGRFDPKVSYEVNGATAANTDCRIMCSTYQGSEGYFYDCRQRTNLLKISLPWTLHPEKMVGAEPTAENRLGHDSPWRRDMAQRLMVAALIAQDIDMDPEGSQSSFFAESIIQGHIKEYARKPVSRKRFELYGRSCELLLWDFVDPPPADEQYVMGSDISTGNGATNSTLTVASRRTRQKVAALATPHFWPDRFAEIVVQIGRLFNDAHLIWEMYGPGITFGKRVVELGYQNIYFRKDEVGLTEKVQGNLTPGWTPTEQNKMMVLQDYARCLSTGSFVNPEEEALKECRSYIYDAGTGKVVNHRANTITDPSGARQNHGDRVIADALACKALGQEPQSPPTETSGLPRDRSVLLPGHQLHYSQWARMLEAELGEQENDEWQETSSRQL